MMRQLFIALFLMMPLAAMAAGGESVPFHHETNLGNQASLQRGAKMFMNYCSGCHSLQYMRYQRISEDLEIPEEVMENNLILTRGKIHDTIQGTMSKEKAAEWFGKAPPDLTLTARERGADWIYSFLLGFYLDDSRPSGVNNVVMSNTAMPAVLAPLQGFQALKHEEEGESGEADGDLGDDEELYRQTLDVLRSTRRASTSMIQRRLRIGYNRAARLMDLMEDKGIVGPENGSSPREILVDLDNL